MFYLGIDQHASQLTISLRDENGNVVWRRQVSTQPEKLLEFFQAITRRCHEADCGFWAIVEVCGFNDWLLEMLKNFRCQRIVLVQPEESGRRTHGGMFWERSQRKERRTIPRIRLEGINQQATQKLQKDKAKRRTSKSSALTLRENETGELFLLDKCFRNVLLDAILHRSFRER